MSRGAWFAVFIAICTGCQPDVPEAFRDLSKPQSQIEYRGQVNGRFSVDGKSFFGRTQNQFVNAVTPKDPGYHALWDVATGKEIARPQWKRSETPSSGTGDGKFWPIYGSYPLHFGRLHFINVANGEPSEIPDAPGPKESCSEPSFSGNGARLIYSVGAGSDGPHESRVYARTGDRWEKIIAVDGEDGVLSPDGTLAATRVITEKPREVSLCIWSIPNGKLVTRTKAEWHFKNFRFTGDGRYVAAQERKWYLIDASTGSIKLTLEPGFQENNDRFATACADGKVLQLTQTGSAAAELLWRDLSSGKELERRKLQSKVAWLTDYTPLFSPRLVVIYIAEQRRVSEKGSISVSTIEVYDPKNGLNPIATIKKDSIFGVLLSPDATILAAFSQHTGAMFFSLPPIHNP